jgi:acyl dehydratase
MLAAMAPRIVTGAAELKELVGQHIGHSEWTTISQQRIDQFAEATGDRQWIHVDVERATEESPFGGPIAHGYLTLALGPALLPDVLQLRGFRLGVNYGCNKVRFVSPVAVDARVRMGVEVLAVDEIAGGVQQILEFTFVCEGSGKPSCVAEVIYRSYT